MPDTLALLDPLLTQGVSESHWSALLHHALRFGHPPAQRRVYVNRTLRLETIQHIGFDLDWTLADYNRQPMEELTFKLAIDRLIDQGYPTELRRAEFRPDFPRRGLLIDKKVGTVVRMNRHRYVGQAYLGHRRLGRRETIRLYRQEPINPSSERFYHVDSLFELPEAALYAELVELAERRPSLGLPEHRKIFVDARKAIDWLHADGPLKRQILADTASYLRRDEELGLALLRLALSGRRLILITNSPWSFAAPICSFLFDGLLPGLDSWRQLFDLVIVASRKPGFFRKGRPFTQLDDSGQERGETGTPEWGGAYSGGNLEGLMRLLDCPGENVLYVGDHIYGDIVSSKLESTWRTALVVSELEDELRKRKEMAYELGRLAELRERLADLGHQMDRLHDVVTLYKTISKEGPEVSEQVQEAIHTLFGDMRDHHRNVRLRVSRLSERISDRFNPYWGSFFKQGSSKTLFAAQLEAYSCLFTSRVSNFGFYGTNHYFRVVEDPMMHEGNGE
jgi:HAD superfamily 5'-nucleotidase-like hydrolase